MTVLRRAYVPVLPELDGFDRELLEKLRSQDPGSKAGKQIGGQLNRALKRLNLDPIDVKADPKQALAQIEATEARLKRLAAQSPTVDVKVKIEQGLSQLARFKKQLGDTGGEAAEEFTSQFAKDVGKLGVTLDRLNLPAIDITADPDQAFRSIDEVEAKLKKLSSETTTVEVRVEAERALGDLGRIKKQLGEQGDEAAKGFASKFTQGLAVLKSPQVLGPAAAAVAPIIGATISAAVIGGAGIGGVVGGLLLVKDDPRVQTAGQALGEKLLGSLKADASPFIDPVLAAAAKIEGRFGAMNDRIKNIFSTSSGFLAPLVDGALDGVEGILKGIESLVTKGRPVIDALGNSFSIIGGSIGKALSVVSGGSDEAASAVTNLAKAVGVLIESGGYLVRTLTDIYGVVSFLPGKFKELEYWVGGVVVGNKNYRESIDGVVAGTAAQVVAMVAAGRAASSYGATQEQVTAAQLASKQAQDDYARSLDAVGGRLSITAQYADGLRRATTNLYGAQIAATDANESYEASWDSLSDSIQTNGRSLNIHTAAGRANRDALQALLQKNNELYFADINAGVSIDKARTAHEKRTVAVEKEADKLKINKDATKDLINTYGRIPPTKTTDLVLDGVRAIVAALQNLYIYQRSLATGKSIASIEQTLRTGSDSGPAKRHGGFASGGAYEGQLPGAPSSVDNLTGIGPDGRAFGLAGGEFIVNSKQSAKYRAELEDLNAGRNGFAAGGLYAPVDTSRRWPFHTDVSGTRIPSRAEVEAKVVLPVPSGGRTSDWIVRAARQIVPGIEVLSKDRPGARTLTGNVSYHALGRAVDFHWNRKLAEVWNQRYKARTKELITPWQDLNIQNGARHSYSPLVYNQHNFAGGNPHDHIAMDDGGFRVLQPGLNLIRNGTGRPEPIGGPAAMAAMGGDVHLHLDLRAAVITSERQAVDLVVKAYNTAVRERQIVPGRR